MTTRSPATVPPPSLATLTTLKVGGPARRLVRAADEAEIVSVVRAADAAGEPLLIVGGGSNLLVADAGFDGAVLLIEQAEAALTPHAAGPGHVDLRVPAGQPWDALVAATLRRGWAGLEALSGIPGLTGATPVQNVGAYGVEVAQLLLSVRALDRETGEVVTLSREALAFGYRDSLLKRTTVGASPRYVVLSVDLRLRESPLSEPVRYAELARALGVAVGERAPAAQVRRAVLALRAAKGMVLDPADADTTSAGSFFTNPVVDAAAAARLPEGAPRWPVGTGPDARVKLSAAWLIEHAGFGKGFGLPGSQGPDGVSGFDVAQGRASLSTKHALALTNRGGASAADLLALARTVRDGVERRFGVRLEPEPLLVGCRL